MSSDHRHHREVYEIVVEYSETSTVVSPRHCSPSPSTSSASSSSSSASSAPSSGATSPSGSSTSSTTRRIRRLSKTKKSTWSRKFSTAGKAKYAKRHTSSSSSKMRLVKLKIDKQHQERLAASRARVERLQREREELLAGNSQLAIMCESVTTNARSLRESYERQRAVVQGLVYRTLVGADEAEDDDDMEEEDYDGAEGFIGTIFY